MPELPEDPSNREPQIQDLVQNFITSKENAYDRNHCIFPHLDASTHRIIIDGDVKKPLELTIQNLRNDYEQHSVICALQCAGNRRHTMRTKQKEVSGLDWFDGAIMNCKWTGPRLVDVLERAGVIIENGHVAFACNATLCQEDTWYGSSIPLSRAMDRDMDVILALKMNDEPLTVGHGHPVRLITPGIAGARAVKWLDHITVQKAESRNHYMVYDYKVLPPDVETMETASGYWEQIPPVQEMPINSVIGVPTGGSEINRHKDGTLTVRGYAVPEGAAGPVVKVEVSGDAGESWQEATLITSEDESRWSWKLWETRLNIEPGHNRSIFSRATDAGGNTQPKQSEWNLRGVCYNGWGDCTELTIT
jgi:sulfite oxidase